MGADISKALKDLDFHGSVNLKESQAKALWDRYDVNSDGRLDIHEIRALCYDWCNANGIRKSAVDEAALLKMNRMVQHVVDQFLTIFDKDHDGYVTKEEFFGRLRNHQVINEDPSRHSVSENAPPSTPKSEHHSLSGSLKAIGAVTHLGKHEPPKTNNTAAFLKDVIDNPLAHRATYGSSAPPEASESVRQPEPSPSHAHESHTASSEPKAEPHHQAHKSIVPPLVSQKSVAELSDEEVAAMWEQKMLTEPGLKGHVHEGMRNLPASVKRNLLQLNAEETKKHHTAAKSLVQREAEITAREQKLASQKEELAVLERKLEAYAEQVAVREGVVAEREAKAGIHTEALGVTAALFPPSSEEIERLKREFILRRAARHHEEEQITVDLAKQRQWEQQVQKERGYGNADGISFGFGKI